MSSASFATSTATRLRALSAAQLSGAAPLDDSANPPAPAAPSTSEAAALARVQGVQDMLRRGQPRKALAELEALREWVEAPGVDEPLLREWNYQYAEVLFEVGEYSRSAEHARMAADLARRAGIADVEVIATIQQARAAYQLGRYSDCQRMGELALRLSEAYADPVLISRACLILIIVHGARRHFSEADGYGQRALDEARRSGNPVQVGRILNAVAQTGIGVLLSRMNPGSGGHSSSVEPGDAADHMQDLQVIRNQFEEALALTDVPGEEALHSMVQSNLQRVRVMMGEAAETLPFLRRKLRDMQQQGRRHYEISLRQFYAWALRSSGHPEEALVQIDAALALCRKGGNMTRIVEFLHYDRSLVQSALGNAAEALKSYQRYRQFAAAWQSGAGQVASETSALESARQQRLLEPFYVKRADRFLRENLSLRVSIDELAAHCGVSPRTLQQGFKRFRGVSPVAHARNLRLEESHAALRQGEGSVAEVAARLGFGSLTTFSLEYRRRFGQSPRETLFQARRQAA